MGEADCMQPAIIQPNGWAAARPGDKLHTGPREPGMIIAMLTLSDHHGHELARRASPGHLVSITACLVCCVPLLVLALRGWANAVLYLGALGGLLALAWGELPRLQLPARERRWAQVMVLVLAAPIVTVAFSALLRLDPYLPQFDSPLRFLLAIPIFLLVLRSGWPVGRTMQWVLPLALLVALLELQVVGQDPKWPTFRLTTHAVDPLVFGYFSLAFGLMCLASIAPGDWREGRRWSVVLRLAALALGVYFSVKSFSRTGWAAVPLVIGTWAYVHWGRRHPLGSLGVAAGVALMLVGAYLFVPSVEFRIDEAIRDVVEYPWNGVLQRETSLGYRITFLRIATDLLASNPWAGLGDFSRLPPPLHAFPYAAPEAVTYGFRSGFHNQVVSSAVRNGVGGLVATGALLVVPWLICARAALRGPGAPSKVAMMGLAYCTCVIVSSLSTEVFDLKFAASFYAVMTAVFCAASLRASAGAATPD